VKKTMPATRGKHELDQYSREQLGMYRPRFETIT